MEIHECSRGNKQTGKQLSLGGGLFLLTHRSTLGVKRKDFPTGAKIMMDMDHIEHISTLNMYPAVYT